MTLKASPLSNRGCDKGVPPEEHATNTHPKGVPHQQHN